jgi:hypothetical protein
MYVLLKKVFGSQCLDLNTYMNGSVNGYYMHDKISYLNFFTPLIFLVRSCWHMAECMYARLCHAALWYNWAPWDTNVFLLSNIPGINPHVVRNWTPLFIEFKNDAVCSDTPFWKNTFSTIQCSTLNSVGSLHSKFCSLCKIIAWI